MSGLHVWYSKLKWSMDVLLRFYERHAFICGLHKETRLLFDELIFCLQRLYSMPMHIDLPFTPELLDDIPAVAVMTPTYSEAATSSGDQTLASISCQSRSIHGCLGQKHSYHSNNSTTSNCCSNCVCADDSCRASGCGQIDVTRRPTSAASSKSRIPRPISLPKRLEAKLAASPSTRTKSTSRVRASPTTGPVRPTTASASAVDRKSRVRDTIKLFDSKTSSTRASRGAATTSRKQILKSPKTGGGEAMMGLEEGRR